MKKSHLIAIGLFLLNLNACQAPGQNLTPEAAKKLNYSRQVAAAFKTYTKDSFEGLRQNPQLLAGGLPGSSQSVPTGSNPLVSAFNTSAQPGSSAATMAPAKPPSLEEALKVLELLKKLMQAMDKANQELGAKIGALTPPAELADKHAKLVEYISLSHELAQDMLKLLEAGPSAAKDMAEFASMQKERLEKVSSLGTQAQGYLYELYLGNYRQDRLALQQGPALSRDAYILKMRSLLPKLPGSIDHPERLFSEAQPDAAEAKALLADLASVHPPEDFEESHTVLYASLRLQQDVAAKLPGIYAADPEAKNLAQKPFELLVKLLNDSELTGKLVEFSVIVPKAQGATGRIIKG